MDKEQLRRALGAIGWSQRQLALRLGLDTDTVNRWATGRIAVPKYATEYLRVMLLAKEISDGA